VPGQAARCGAGRLQGVRSGARRRGVAGPGRDTSARPASTRR
jgi:hypothetical protein